MIKMRPYIARDVYSVELKDIFYKEPNVLSASDEVAKDPDNIAFSFVVDDRVIGVIGTRVLWNGVAEVWSVLSEEIKKYPIFFHKNTLRELNTFQKEKGIHRLQALVLSDFCTGTRWIARLGFIREGVLKKFGPYGDNFDVWARVV